MILGDAALSAPSHKACREISILGMWPGGEIAADLVHWLPGRSQFHWKSKKEEERDWKESASGPRLIRATKRGGESLRKEEGRVGGDSMNGGLAHDFVDCHYELGKNPFSFYIIISSMKRVRKRIGIVEKVASRYAFFSIRRYETSIHRLCWVFRHVAQTLLNIQTHFLITCGPCTLRHPKYKF